MLGKRRRGWYNFAQRVNAPCLMGYYTESGYLTVTYGGFDFFIRVNPYLVGLINLSFHPLEVVSRYRDQRLQEGVNYPYLFNLSTHFCKI